MSIAIHTYRHFTAATPRPVVHGSFGRDGGVSSPPYDSLNVGYGVEDLPERVAENRRRVRRALGLNALVSARQVHGDRICLLREPVAEDTELEGYDALVTDCPGIGLLIQQADCQAVMLHDPRRGAVANIHAGWRGSAANIIGSVIALMSRQLGSRPAELLAAVSPSLGPCCAEFINYRRELPVALHRYRLKADHFDFWAISRDQLLAAGLRPGHIELAGVCTRCNPAYFSYRRQRRCGRNASVIAL